MLSICLLPLPIAIASQTGSSILFPAGTSSDALYPSLGPSPCILSLTSESSSGARDGSCTRTRHDVRSLDAKISSIFR
ncbi:unnamed protein product [Schistosoma mattheei]|uniref:Uncharacterized protein n=1 Tax=Schistosoma mattheei TaxID=31246 RepID=A0A183NRL6_9TREM|nr:unnamed protein product [Schistosoma mattheei]